MFRVFKGIFIYSILIFVQHATVVLVNGAVLKLTF